MDQQLCTDMLYQIVTHLSLADTFQLRQVSRTLYRVAERVWERRLSLDFSLYLSEHPRQYASAYQEYCSIQRLMQQAPTEMRAHIDSIMTEVDPQLIGDYLLVSLFYPSPPFNVLAAKTRQGTKHIVLHDIVINRINHQMYSVVPPHIDCLLACYQHDRDRELYQGVLPKIGAHLAPKTPLEFFGQDLYQALIREEVLCNKNDFIFDMSVASELIEDITNKGYIITDNTQYTTVKKIEKEPHLWKIVGEC